MFCRSTNEYIYWRLCGNYWVGQHIVAKLTMDDLMGEVGNERTLTTWSWLDLKVTVGSFRCVNDNFFTHCIAI